MEMEEKKLETNTEQNLPVQELPADIPAEVRQKLAEDLNEETTMDDIELAIVQDYYSRNRKHLEES